MKYSIKRGEIKDLVLMENDYYRPFDETILKVIVLKMGQDFCFLTFIVEFAV